MFDHLMPLPVLGGSLWRSEWPPAIFTPLFSIGLPGGLHMIEKLDLIVGRMVYREPVTQLYASRLRGVVGVSLVE